MGFINNETKGYHYLTKEFLNEPDADRKKLLYSKIVYENSSFSRSFSNISNDREINFLVKTLEECGTISKDELMALIYTDISKYNKGYLSKEELRKKYSEVLLDDGAKRKYNQRNYLFNLCSNLTDIYVKNDIMSLDPNIMLDRKEKGKGRDAYLQRLYKIDLINEFKKLYHEKKGKCVLEKLAYPVLIASHIKPYRDCNEKEQFDKNNGLLLSKNLDSLFDLGYITFDENGNTIPSSHLDSDVALYVKRFKLDSIVYNSHRKQYMEYHRKNVFLQ